MDWRLSILTTTTNFKSIPLLRQWCMLTLPTVFNDALSYEEQVCKLTQAINEMATTINGLPDYIIELVKELLDQMNLEEIVKQVLADYFFINVKNPPAPLVAAKGDGIANDTAAIQSMINHVSGKKNYLFFPAGIYSVNQLTMVPNVSLVGQDRFQAIINLEAGSNTDLLTGEMGNCTISNLTLSANMPGQTQNCSVYHGNVTSMLFDNVIFKNGFDVLSLDIDGLVQMSSIVVDGAQGNGVMIGGSRCSVDVIDFMNTSTLNNETLLTVSGANHVIQNVTCYTAIKNGLVVNGNNNVVKGVILNAITPVTNTGTNNRIEIVTTNNNIEIQNGTAKTISGPYEVSAASSTEMIAGDKDVMANNVEISARGNLNVHGATTDVGATNGVTVAGKDVTLNPTNPLGYKAPQVLNDYFKYVEFQNNNTVYNVLVAGDEILNIGNPFNTVADMVSGTMESGFATCLGYYTVGDSVPLYYIIKDTGTADGGSVIALDNGKFAHAVFGEAVTPNSFGIIGQPADLSTRWTNYLNYVNTTAGKYFYLPDMLYYTPITLHVNKSIIGNINKTEIQTNAVIPDVPGETVGAVVWLDNQAHFSTSNLECKHIYINSTTGIGLYIKAGTAYDVQNVTINNATWIGCYIRTAWHSQFRDMFISSETGAIYNFAYHYNDTTASGTTCVFENLYSSGKAASGYYFGKLQYSSLINLSCDTLPGEPDTIYTIWNSTVDISGIGAEQMKAKNFITMTNSNVNISAISMEGVTLSEYVFLQYGGGNLTVDSGYIPTPTSGKLIHLDGQTATVYSVINWNLTKAVDKTNMIVKTGNVVYTAIVNGYNDIAVGSNNVALKSIITP
nr:MAG TPA: tail spike protein [Caudoviricetes sp.]